MRVTKRLFASACPAALLALPLAFSVTPAFAQSTGSQAIETVTVTGTRVNLSGGLDSYLLVPKQQSSISQDFIQTQPAGQTFFQDLNMLPGVNFTSNDAYGSSGGNIRMHGQDGNHISVTLDGMPLNDTGNYAIYTNQMLDPEIIGRVTINQGTTDVDSPTAAVTGGTINVASVNPNETFGLQGTISAGTNAFLRGFGKVDTGNIGPWDTRAYATYSYTSYDNFKGPGKIRKAQINGKIYQDMGSVGWMSLAFHFNRNRNNFINNAAYTAYGVRPTDWTTDYDATCSFTAPTAGIGDKTMTGCSNWYKLRINPSDTGNLRYQSLWHLTPDLTFTADASLQYVLANGGGSTTFAESVAAANALGTSASQRASYAATARQLIGNTSGGSGTTTTPYGCIPGVGCDLNGDGDVRDLVQIYRPNTTNTRRWGFNSSLIYSLSDTQTFRVAYTLDYGVHRQTGQATFFDPVSGPYNPFAGWEDKAHQVKSADGADIRGRDRNSRAILNQIAFDYQGSFLNDQIGTSIGVREPFFKRDLDQRCYTQIGSYNVMCTTEVPNAPAANGTITFNGVTTNGTTPQQYVPLATKTVNYNKMLPHIGIWAKPFGDQHYFYFNFTKELAAPRTDYLYTSTGSIYTGGTISQYSAFENVKPETSTSFMIGYRFLSADFNASLALWNQQVKNRLVSSYDPDQGIYTDRNVPGVNYAGGDMDFNWQIIDDLNVYGSATYTSARLIANIPINSTVTAMTAGKQLSEVAKWMFTGRVQYNVASWLHVGVGGKQVSKRFISDDNNLAVPGYFTMNANAIVDLDSIGMADSSLKFNVDNLWNRHYYGNLSTVTCWTSQSGCTSRGYATPTAPRSFMVTLTGKF